MDGRATRVVYAHKAACRVQLLEFLLRQLRRGVGRRRVPDWACRLVRRGHRDAEDIFPEVRLRVATAYRVAAHWDAFVQVQLRDDNSEARQDAAAHRKAVHRGEPETFGLAKEDCLQAAVLPNLFPKPTQDFQMAQQRQDAVTQEHPADRTPEV